MWTATFWRDAAERSIATALETLVALLGLSGVAGTVEGAGALLRVHWLGLLAASALAGVLTLAKVIAAGLGPLGDPGTAGLVRLTRREAP